MIRKFCGNEEYIFSLFVKVIKPHLLRLHTPILLQWEISKLQEITFFTQTGYKADIFTLKCPIVSDKIYKVCSKYFLNTL